MLTYPEFCDNLAKVRERLNAACQSAGRSPSDVTLLPVTKNHPPQAVEYAIQAGLIAIGENRIQEAMEKKQAVSGVARWELIGHLQSNKTKQAIDTFDRIQTVDSIKLANRLHRQLSEENRSIAILLQVNAGKDPAKYGLEPDELNDAMEALLALPSLRMEGLMTIAPLDDNPDVARRCFARLRELRDTMEQAWGIALPVLSMGMSDDLEAAIAEGSTLIRIGTALFGQRQG